MMLKKKSNPWARLKYLYVLPLAAVAVAAFARPEISTELNEISALKVNDLAAMVKTEEVKSFETVPVSGQEKKVKVKGNIRDKADNSPMVGVAVIVKGTTTGSVTDLDGNFVLEIPEGSTLVCSYVGYGTKEFPVRPGVTEINGVMEKDNSDAAGQTKCEVRVVGLGEQKGMEPTPVLQVVEEMPEFPGGMAECLKFLAQNIKYPVEAQQEGIQGKVIVQFVVEKDGSISNPIVLRSIDPRLDGEAIRVVSIMPKWKPGMQEGQLVRVKYTIPISFSLNKKEPSEVASMDMDIRFDGKRPLVVMDGQKVAWDTIQRLDPSKIESFHILGESRTKESYGEEGKDGVILITTKKEKKK